jgi:hypothetical protein
MDQVYQVQWAHKRAHRSRGSLQIAVSGLGTSREHQHKEHATQISPTHQMAAHVQSEKVDVSPPGMQLALEFCSPSTRQIRAAVAIFLQTRQPHGKLPLCATPSVRVRSPNHETSFPLMLNA